jgi:hypothetical protein
MEYLYEYLDSYIKNTYGNIMNQSENNNQPVGQPYSLSNSRILSQSQSSNSQTLSQTQPTTQNDTENTPINDKFDYNSQQLSSFKNIILSVGKQHLESLIPQKKTNPIDYTNIKNIYTSIINKSLTQIFREGDVIIDINYGNEVSNMTKTKIPNTSNTETITYNFTNSGVSKNV